MVNDSKILRMKIIKFALLQLDKEYIHDTYGPNSFDCAGFVFYVFDQVLGIDLFQGGYGQSTTTKMLTSPIGVVNYDLDLNKIKKADILFFHTKPKNAHEPTPDNKYPGHCGIYLGNHDVIHCTRMGELNRVAITRLGEDNELSEKLTKKLVASKNIIDYK